MEILFEALNILGFRLRKQQETGKSVSIVIVQLLLTIPTTTNALRLFSLWSCCSWSTCSMEAIYDPLSKYLL